MTKTQFNKDKKIEGPTSLQHPDVYITCDKKELDCQDKQRQCKDKIYKLGTGLKLTLLLLIVVLAVIVLLTFIRYQLTDPDKATVVEISSQDTTAMPLPSTTESPPVQVKLQYWRRTHMYSVPIPRNGYPFAISSDRSEVHTTEITPTQTPPRMTIFPTAVPYYDMI